MDDNPFTVDRLVDAPAATKRGQTETEGAAEKKAEKEKKTWAVTPTELDETSILEWIGDTFL